MLNVALYAVVGGAAAGLACGKLLGNHSLTSYAVAGALGGTVGLIIYATLRATLGQPILFVWEGMWWTLLGVLSALMTWSILIERHRR